MDSTLDSASQIRFERIEVYSFIQLILNFDKYSSSTKLYSTEFALFINLMMDIFTEPLIAMQ